MIDPAISAALQKGIVIPAHPLAVDQCRKLDERSQRALSRYYLAAGAGGLAVGVHTTQFAIHDSKVGLYKPVLELAREEMDSNGAPQTVRVAGILGRTEQAVREASLAAELKYHLGLLSLSALKGETEDNLLHHCKAVADVIPLFGFYLQPSVGGVALPYSFWRRFVEIENVVAIKIAAFDRYETLNVVRAVADAGRTDIALYTGNDDSIVVDLVSEYRFATDTGFAERSFAGGLLGHWAVWTRPAVELLRICHAARADASLLLDLLRRSNEVTDCNAVLFDASNNFAGCIPGIMEVLRRQGLVQTSLCLDEREVLSPGQAAEIDRICRSYPHLMDDEFVASNCDNWRN